MGKHRKASKADSHQNSNPVDSAKVTSSKQSAAIKHPSHKRNSQLLDPRPDWHGTPLPSIHIPDTLHNLPPEVLRNVQEYAESLLEAESATYDQTNAQNNSDHKFMTTVMKSGTWSDKVSALTLAIQESPLHTGKHFDSLLGMAGKRSRDNALSALNALKDMLSQGQMLPSRKLRYFSKQPGLFAAFQNVKKWESQDPLPTNLSKRHLIFWQFEDWLKRSYFEVLKLLETWSGDSIENTRKQSLSFIFDLLVDKPEQEENLLRLLVNKLGDNNKRIASKSSHYVLQLQTKHPSMKGVIIGAIESDILFKPGQTNHAKYYAAITLNQTFLNTADPTTADKLLDVYFGVFTALLNQSKPSSKSIKTAQTPPKEQPGKRKRASNPEVPADDSDNPDKQLEDKLVAQVLTGIQRAFPYASRENHEKLEAHIQTLFTITHSSNFGTSLRALLLLHSITSSHYAATSSSNLRDRYIRTLYESLLDPRLITATGKHTMYFNLLYRTLKADISISRVKAFVKRLLQICGVHEPPFIVSANFLVRELINIYPSLGMMVSQPEVKDIDSDEEEVYHDAPDPDEFREAQNASPPVQQPQKQDPDVRVTVSYDARKRDPAFAHAELSSLWDVLPMMQHYHPSVSLFGSSFLPNQAARPPPKPDPTSHTLSHFLDRFAYRNPKTPRDASSGDPKALRGSSKMQPALASSGTTDHFISSVGPGQGEAPVSSEDFWQRRADQVAPDDVFFHRYFSTVGPARKAAKDRKFTDSAAGTGDGDFDEGIGAGEDEIWSALMNSRPDLEGEESDEGGADVDEESVDEDFEKAMVNGSDEDIEEDGGVELNLESDEESEDQDTKEEVDQTFREVNGELGDDLSEEGEEEDGAAIFGAEAEEDDEDSAAEGANRTESRGQSRKAKRRKLSSMPMFASADEYAKMIEEGERDEDSA